jgi:hypothetical protein
MTTRPSLQFSTPSRGHLPVASFLAGALLVLGCALFCSISSANAGEWVQRSCSYGTEYIVPEGWEGKEVNGYVNPNQGRPFDGCLGFNMGGGLWAEAAGANGDQPGAGEMWVYKPPRESTIAGGMLTVRMKAHNGDAQIDAATKSGPAVLANCESPNCSTERNEFVPITVSNATMLSEWAWCFAGHEPDLCPAEQEFAYCRP